MRRLGLPIVMLLLGVVAAPAQECSQLAPNSDHFRQSLEVNRLREADLRTKLKIRHRTDYALILLGQYNELLNQSLTIIDDMETRSNKVQELRCPGWDRPDQTAETALVIKNLKARIKKSRTQVADKTAALETAMKAGQKRMVAVTFE